MSNQSLRKEIKNLEAELNRKILTLGKECRFCQHNWSGIVYTPIINEAYTIPGDPVETRGSDWRGPVHVPQETIPEWKRTCTLCGSFQTTRITKDQVTHNNGLQTISKVPDFKHSTLQIR